MNQVIFYNLEKNNVRLSIQGDTTYETAISTCQEFIAKLQEDMAARIAAHELELKKAAEKEAAAQQVAAQEPVAETTE